MPYALLEQFDSGSKKLVENGQSVAGGKSEPAATMIYGNLGGQAPATYQECLEVKTEHLYHQQSAGGGYQYSPLGLPNGTQTDGGQGAMVTLVASQQVAASQAVMTLSHGQVTAQAQQAVTSGGGGEVSATATTTTASPNVPMTGSSGAGSASSTSPTGGGQPQSQQQQQAVEGSSAQPSAGSATVAAVSANNQSAVTQPASAAAAVAVVTGNGAAASSTGSASVVSVAGGAAHSQPGGTYQLVSLAPNPNPSAAAASSTPGNASPAAALGPASHHALASGAGAAAGSGGFPAQPGSQAATVPQPTQQQAQQQSSTSPAAAPGQLLAAAGHDMDGVVVTPPSGPLVVELYASPNAAGNGQSLSPPTGDQSHQTNQLKAPVLATRSVPSIGSMVSAASSPGAHSPNTPTSNASPVSTSPAQSQQAQTISLVSAGPAPATAHDGQQQQQQQILHMTPNGALVQLVPVSADGAKSEQQQQQQTTLLQAAPGGALPLGATLVDANGMPIRDYLGELTVSGQTEQATQIIHVDQNGQPIDPNQLNGTQYVYQIVTPNGTTEQKFVTLGPASTSASTATTLTTSTLQPNQTIPIGQQVLNATQGIQIIDTSASPVSSGPTRGAKSAPRGRPKKYVDPLSQAVELCLDGSQPQQPAQTQPAQAQPSQFATVVSTTTGALLTTSSTPTVHHCRAPGCGFVSSDILEFRNHNRTQHRDESTIIPSRKGKAAADKGPLMCEVPGCGYSPKYRRLLIDHQNAHKGLRAHKCCFCDYNSSYFGDIRKHMIKKHPDLAQEIKVSKLKLKAQAALEGKTSKSSRDRKRDASQAQAGGAAPGGAGGPDSTDGSPRKKYSKKSGGRKSKKAQAAEAEALKQQQQQQVPQTVTLQHGIQPAQQQIIQLGPGQVLGPQHPQAIPIQVAGQPVAQHSPMQQQQQAQAQYNFVTAPQPTQYATNDPTGQVYGQAQPTGMMPQTAIIYVQTANGQTVQLATNDMNTLNQLISGYTDINQLINSATQQQQQQLTNGAQQVQVQPGQANQQVVQQQQTQQQVQHQQLGNGQQQQQVLLSNGQSFALTEQSQTTTIYKCDSPHCYFQSPDYDAVILHKHRDHGPQQGQQQQQQQQQAAPNPGQGGQTQQVTIIDANGHAQQSQTLYIAPGGAQPGGGQFTNLDFATLTNQHVTTVDSNGQLQNLIFATDQNGQQILLQANPGVGGSVAIQSATAATS